MTTPIVSRKMQNVTIEEVRRALEMPRPGRDAQIRMSPRPRPGDIFPLPPEIHPKEAGVLILLFPGGNTDLSFLLTRRTEQVETHKGQISLPGGMREPGEALWKTALREVAEELNLNTDGIQVFRKPLTPVYIPVSGFRVTPYVGFMNAQPSVRGAPNEVVDVIETPLNVILDREFLFEEEWEMHDTRAIVPFFLVSGFKVWGATAMILSEFREMLLQAKSETLA